MHNCNVSTSEWQEEAKNFELSSQQENASASFNNYSARKQIVQGINKNVENGVQITQHTKYKKNQEQYG